MNSAVIILGLTILAAIAAFIATNKDNAQKDRIEDLGKINKDLSVKVAELAKLNNDIALQVDTIVKENKFLAKKNIELSSKANSLIIEVQNLSSKSNILANKLDIKTDQEFAVTGELNLQVDNEEDSHIIIDYGGNIIDNPIDSYYKDFNINNFLRYKDLTPFFIRVQERKLLLNCKVYTYQPKYNF